jgi:DnaJ domain
MRDPYQFLAVPRSATAEDISKSFRLLAKKLHPDINKNDPKAAVLLAELNAAHAILGDKARRRAFDRGEIDAEGKLIPNTAAISSLTLSLTVLMVAVAMFFASLAASTLLMRSPIPEMGMSDGRDRDLSRVGANEEGAPLAQSEQPDSRVWSESRLRFPQSVSYAAAHTIPLGIQVTGEPFGLALEISGLPSRTTISRGRRLPGVGGWRILAADVGNAMIYLPPGFSGAIDLAVELRFFDDTVVDRGLLHFECPQTDPIKPAGAAAVSESSADKVLATAAPKDQNAIQQATDSQRDHELLIGRSEKLLSEGDVEAARILLQPAAEARDARAALALGSTYDPIVLAILQAHGVAADVSLALDWYKKAQEFGSREAQQRLRLLATALAEPKRRVVRPPIHVTVSHVAAPRVAALPQNPNGVRVAGDRLGAIPDPSIRDDASRKLPVVFGVSY